MGQPSVYSGRFVLSARDWDPPVIGVRLNLPIFHGVTPEPSPPFEPRGRLSSLVYRKTRGFPGFHTTVHVTDIGESHVFQQFCAPGSIHTELAGGDNLP